MTSNKVNEGKAYLAEHGFKLFSVLKTEALITDIIDLLQKGNVPIQNYKSLVLIGHAGTDFWESFSRVKPQTEHPVDDFSIELTQAFIANYLDKPSFEWLYPSSQYVIPLQRLARLANWSHQSPLGLDISPTYGLWFAHRACFLTNADLEPCVEEAKASPCDSCTTKDCMQACPAGAVSKADFSIKSCIGHRVKDNSGCANTCLSRRACPYFSEHQYSEEQMNYHYTAGFENTKAWYKSLKK